MNSTNVKLSILPFTPAIGHLTAAAFLAGPTRPAHITKWYAAQVEQLGGFPQMVSEWSKLTGVPARLAEAISGLTYATATPDAFVTNDFTHQDVLSTIKVSTEALYADGDLLAAEESLLLLHS